MASAQNAARAVEGEIDVRVVDSKSITAGLGTQLILARRGRRRRRQRRRGAVAVIEAAIPRTHILGGLDTLENLRKGGRIGGAKAMLGTMLSVKPVVDISTGVVEEAGKVRTRKKQMLFLLDQLKAAGAVERLVVCDGEAPDAEEFADLVADVVPRESFTPLHHRPGHRHPRRAPDDRPHLAGGALSAPRGDDPPCVPPRRPPAPPRVGAHGLPASVDPARPGPGPSSPAATASTTPSPRGAWPASGRPTTRSWAARWR